MSVSGTVTSYNPHKGWGFIECNGQDVFVNRQTDPWIGVHPPTVAFMAVFLGTFRKDIGYCKDR